VEDFVSFLKQPEEHGNIDVPEKKDTTSHNVKRYNDKQQVNHLAANDHEVQYVLLHDEMVRAVMVRFA
jgi:hypothetical protein